VDHLPHGLLDSLLPGPVTVVLKRGSATTLFLCSPPNICLNQNDVLSILFLSVHVQVKIAY
jgi:hypothetical protein